MALYRCNRHLILSCLFTAAAFGQGQVQQQHDADLKNQNNANTKYHNNADDYPTNTATPGTNRSGVKRPSQSAQPIYIDPRWKDFDKTREAYQAGDGAAGLAFGTYYYVGSVGGMNKEFAFEVWTKVADKNAHARFLAGRMLYNGEATAMDEARGIAMMKSASASGDAEAAEYLKALPIHAPASTGEFPSMLARVDDIYAREKAEMVSNSNQLKWMKEAIQSLEKHSKKIDYGTYSSAGNAYFYGVGVPLDLSKAKEMFLQSKAMVNPQFTHSQDESLAWVYLRERDKNPAPFIKQAIEFGTKHPWPRSLYLMALAACLDHKPAQQRFYLEQATTHYDASSKAPIEAWVDLAVMQLTGEGGPLQNAQGIKNLMAASSNRHAQFILSQILASGTHGLAKDPAKARLWLEAAAKAGQPDAVRELAGAAHSKNLN